ncbi:unnamed protein product [Sphenostylis stenocarpa]|uniref:Uncharacterized protein n=1 Tax=Sphenostylis stenocarpa TaxID=92480 RepID=A0AA86SKT8_9FABA|nr:unnamed protein product [Sphenostylis stenocarpa]
MPESLHPLSLFISSFTTTNGSFEFRPRKSLSIFRAKDQRNSEINKDPLRKKQILKRLDKNMAPTLKPDSESLTTLLFRSMVRLVTSFVGEPARSVSTVLFYSGLLPHNVILLRMKAACTMFTNGNP